MSILKIFNSENMSVGSKRSRKSQVVGHTKIANDQKSIAQGSAHKYVRTNILNSLNEELERRSNFGNQNDLVKVEG